MWSRHFAIDGVGSFLNEQAWEACDLPASLSVLLVGDSTVRNLAEYLVLRLGLGGGLLPNWDKHPPWWEAGVGSHWRMAVRECSPAVPVVSGCQDCWSCCSTLIPSPTPQTLGPSFSLASACLGGA